jgi:hypothetical protein
VFSSSQITIPSRPIEDEESGSAPSNLESVAVDPTSSDDPEEEQLTMWFTSWHRDISGRRPLDSFSPDELKRIRLAANYLECLGHFEDAFSLYNIILRRHRLAALRPLPKTLLVDVITFSRCALQNFNCGIVERLLKDELGSLCQESDASHAIRYLVLLRLAVIFEYRSKEGLQDGDDPATMLQNESSDAVSLINHLPADDRFLDLPLFHTFYRAHGPKTEEMDFWEWGASPLEESKAERSDDLGNVFLSRKPGPFEIKDGTMENPCIRSCLTWCSQQVDNMTMILDYWNVGLAHMQQWEKDDFLVAHAESEALFVSLWTRWNLDVVSRTETWMWMNATQSRMGITPSELLRVTAELIRRAAPLERTSTPARLIQQFEDGVKKLIRFSNSTLARLFLRKFANNEAQNRYRNQRTQLHLQAARKLHIEQLQRVLRTRFEDLDAGDTPTTTDADCWPTLAASPQSTDLEAFREERLSVVPFASPLLLPTSTTHAASYCSFSAQSISELSDVIMSTMSLSGSSRGSSNRSSHVILGAPVL